MSTPPAHLSHRTLLPGALLAMLVTLGALCALVIVLVVGTGGAARLWLDGGGSTVNLHAGTGSQAGPGAAGVLTLPRSPIGPLTKPIAAHKGAADLAGPRTTVRLRSDTRVQRRTARTPATSRPAQPAPSGTSPSAPTRSVSTPVSTPHPVSTPAPGSTVVKTRGRPKDTDSSPVPVRRQRVRSTSPSSADDPAPASSPAAPVEKQPSHPATPQDTSVGVAEGVLHHVPAPVDVNSGG